MVAKSGDRLLDDDARRRAAGGAAAAGRVVTPNMPEAEVLAGMPIATLDDAREAARRSTGWAPAAVVVKGGHLPGDEVVDLLFDGARIHRVPRAAHRDAATRTARAAPSRPRSRRSWRRPVAREAVRPRKAYVSGAIAHGLASAAATGRSITSGRMGTAAR